jgi:hypothetical protein
MTEQDQQSEADRMAPSVGGILLAVLLYLGLTLAGSLLLLWHMLFGLSYAPGYVQRFNEAGYDGFLPEGLTYALFCLIAPVLTALYAAWALRQFFERKRSFPKVFLGAALLVAVLAIVNGATLYFGFDEVTRPLGAGALVPLTIGLCYVLAGSARAKAYFVK